MTRDPVYWPLLAGLFGVAFAAQAAFVAAPWIDLLAAAAFHDPEEGFPLAADPTVMAGRAAYRYVFLGLCAVAVAGLLGRLLGVEGLRTPARVWIFLVSLTAVGPGLIANAVFKDSWGRPRPAHLEAFGGWAAPALPFEISDACDRNCSFVSGEVAMAASVAVGALAVFGWLLRSAPARVAGGVAAAAFVAGSGFLRMAAGRHFLSDALFGALFVAMTGMALYAALGVGRVRAGVRPIDCLRDAAITLRALGRIGRRLIGRRFSSAD
ncbi:MAG: phosphatase PAP2 family protein [Rhodobacteraceae bacterium]|nr:MAG: phosphatase PAP2 family protein [Paracoccaceae bacterium]